MSSDIVLEFNNVTKKYSRYGGLSAVKNFLDRIKNGQPFKKLVREDDFYALRDVSFKVHKGERVGIIGPNGAGKSTTLKLINQISYPSSGEVFVRGEVGGLIELGSGFQPDLSGRENIYLNRSLYGYSDNDTDKIYDKIVSLAELEHFMDVPIKRYSSGMKIRLGFAVTMTSTPDIVLLDEVLAVGDARFKKKSMSILEDYLKDRTLIFVSHNMKQILEVCERVLVINKGNLVFDGMPDAAVDVYNKLSEDTHKITNKLLVQRNVVRGFAEVPVIEVTDAILSSEKKTNKTNSFSIGSPIVCKCTLTFPKALGDLKLTVMVKSITLGRLTDVVSGKIFTVKELDLSNSNHIFTFRFQTKKLLPGKYILELSPHFREQGKATALAIFKREFQLFSNDKIKHLGVFNLDFVATKT